MTIDRTGQDSWSVHMHTDTHTNTLFGFDLCLLAFPDFKTVLADQ